MQWLHEWWERCYGLEGNLKLLKHRECRVRERASSRIWDLTRTKKDAVRLIIAAGDNYPDEETAGGLIRRFWDDPHPEFVSAIAQVYDRLDARGDSRQTALRLLTEIKMEEAFALVSDLLARPSSRTVDLAWVFVPLTGGFSSTTDPRGVELLQYLLRDFGKYDHLESRSPLLRMLLDFAEKKLIRFDDFPEFQRWCIARCQRLIEQDLPDCELILQDGAQDEMTSEVEIERSSRLRRSADEIERLLHFTRFGQFPGSTAILERGLQSSIKDIRLFAVTTIAAKKIAIPGEIMEDIASRLDMRHRLAILLDRVGRLELLPQAYRTQQSFAEAEMDYWLQYPTEMARSPEAIELLKIIKVDHPVDGASECYCFRFRHTEFYDGKWLVGIAGAYPVAAQPTPDGDWTFSNFDEWSEATVDESIEKLISRRLNREESFC
jgi:hypothetical protein